MSNKETKDYFAKLNLAEKFTGNTRKARLMVEGAYQDIIALKCRFKDSKDSVFGLLTIFLNKYSLYTLDTYGIISAFGSLYSVRPFENWKVFISKINKELDYDKYEIQLTKKLLNHFFDSMNPDQIKDISKRSDKNDLAGITKILRISLKKALQMRELELTVDFEETNSVEVNKVLGSLPPKDASAEEDSSNLPDLVEALKQIEQFEKENDGNIITAKAELSPARGKVLQKLEPGDRIMVIIKEESDKAIDIINKLSAYVYGKVQPIESVVLANFPIESGSIVYSKSDHADVILKMTEREGIRVKCLSDEVDEIASHSEMGGESKSKTKMILLLAVIVAILVFIIIRILYSSSG